MTKQHISRRSFLASLAAAAAAPSLPIVTPDEPVYQLDLGTVEELAPQEFAQVFIELTYNIPMENGTFAVFSE